MSKSEKEKKNFNENLFSQKQDFGQKMKNFFLEEFEVNWAKGLPDTFSSLSACLPVWPEFQKTELKNIFTNKE